MSQERIEVVRKPLRVRQRSSRTLQERLAIRFPGLFDGFIQRLGRLPPTSRLRQVVVAHSVRSAIEAFNRRDLEAMLSRYHAGAEYEVTQGIADLGGVEPKLPVREALQRPWGDVSSVMSGARIDGGEVIDLGDHIVMLGTVAGRGAGGGVPISEPYATASALRDGKAIHTHAYLDHAEALDAVGLGE